MKLLNKTNITEIIIILICIILILPLLVIAIYNRPSADDYDYAILTHQIVENGGSFFELLKAAWDTNINFYNSWQGLYSSAFILSLQPGIFGTSYYAYTTFIICGIAYLCLLISIHIINKHFLKKSFLFTITASTVVLSIIMLCMRSPIEGLYWYNGAMNYIPFVFFIMLNISLLFEAITTENIKKRSILLVITTVMSFLISGGNHVTSFENILLLLTIMILCLKKRNFEKIVYVLLPFITACIGFFIMYSAPGTQIRQSLLSQQGIFDTILATIKILPKVAFHWCSFTWLITLVLITPIAIEFATKNKEKFSKSFPILPIIFFITIISGMYCVPYFAMGYFGAGRVTNVIWISFLIFSWIIYFRIWIYLIKNNIIVKIDKFLTKNDKFIIVFACMIMLFILNSNSLTAIKELYDNTAYYYSFEMDERTKLYCDKDLTEVVVSPIKAKSKLLFFSDIGQNPNEWPNTSISKYYNKVIYLKK